MTQAKWRPTGDREIRVGLIGLGSMGRNHARVLAQVPGACLAGVSDALPDVVERFTESSGVVGYADPTELLSDGRLDAVIIASPTTTHEELALEAITRGLAVLVEKPMTASAAGARTVVAAAMQTGVPVQVGHIERFNPAIQELGRRLEAGWLTSVYAITSRRGGPMPERIRDVGVTIDLATHDVDIISWIARERPESVTAEMAYRVRRDHEDLLFGLMRFPSGTVAMLDVDWLTPSKRRTLSVVGEEGMFELDYLTQHLTFTKGTDLSHPELVAGYAPIFVGEAIEIPVDRHEPLAAEIESFLEVVRTGRQPIVDVRDGHWAIVLAEALIAAAQGGCAVEPSL